MVVSGLPLTGERHTHDLARMAQDMLAAVARHNWAGDLPISIRIGIASGTVTAGVIGKRKFSYDVWGDPVNLASRLEGLSRPGRILICRRTRELLADTFTYEPSGPLEIKGFGRQHAWFLRDQTRATDRDDA